MKKTLRKTALLLIMIMIVQALTGCVGKTNKSDKISIVTTIFASYDFARQIAGDNADITLLLKPGEGAHTYEPTPNDIVTINKCDIFIYVGGENDEWVDDILGSMDTSDMTIIRMLECVDKYEEEIVDGMQHDDDHDHDHDDTAEWDEHVWTDPGNAIIISEKITEALVKIDPENQSDYKTSLEKYKAELTELDEAFTEVVENAVRNTIIIGDKFPLRYFIEAYGFEYYAAFPGCSEESEVSASTIAFLIDKVKEENIPVIFTIELSNGNVAKAIADDTGAKVLTFNTCHNLTKDDFENGETYLSLMYKNLDAIKEALN